MNIGIIAKRISQLCKQYEWSYYKLAKKAGFEQSTLTPILHEKNMPNLYTISAICNAFDISLSDFFYCDLFNDSNITEEYIKLWQKLNIKDREKVLIYMNGLLHNEIL